MSLSYLSFKFLKKNINAASSNCLPRSYKTVMKIERGIVALRCTITVYRTHFIREGEYFLEIVI
jgi:hypothetical protein